MCGGFLNRIYELHFTKHLYVIIIIFWLIWFDWPLFSVVTTPIVTMLWRNIWLLFLISTWIYYYKCRKTMDIVHIKYVHKVVYLSTISTETRILDIYSERMICFKTEVSSSLWIKLNKTKNLIDTRNCNGESLWIHYLLGCW